MRKVRGSKINKGGFTLKMVVAFERDWLTYLLVFLSSVLGILGGFLIGKIAAINLIVLLVIFLGLVIGGLFIAWSINYRDQLLGQYILSDNLKQQYNALTLLLKELEYNLTVEDVSLVSTKAWEVLKYEWAYFPTYIYEEVTKVYSKFDQLEENMDSGEYRLILLEELNLPGTITKLKDFQQRIKRQLPYS